MRNILTTILVCFSLFFNFVIADELININLADIETLDTLPGIGESKAQAIIDYRVDNGFFVSLEDIMNVSGIGQATFDGIKSLITLEDLQLPIIDYEYKDIGTSTLKETTVKEVVVNSDGGELRDFYLPAGRQGVVAETPPQNDSVCLLGEVVINEFVSDPGDGEEEWIELFNTTDRDIDISDWYIEEGKGSKTTINGIIKSKGFFIIEKPKGNLNNTGDLILLKEVGGKLVDKVTFGGWDDGQVSDNAPKANDPKSVARKVDGYNSFNNSFDFIVTDIPTKGEENIIVNKVLRIESEEINTKSPLIENSSQEDNSQEENYVDFNFNKEVKVGVPINFYIDTNIEEKFNTTWDFGDGIVLILKNPQHTYLEPGIYDVVLRVDYKEAVIEVEKKIELFDLNINLDVEEVAGSSTDLIITEIFPNPESDESESEWIEIYNKGIEKINLANWTLDDGEGRSRGYKFSEDIWVNPGEYFVLGNDSSKISLNNSYDTVRLFDTGNRLIDSVSYDKSYEAESFARNDDNWDWTIETTPGKENKIIKVNESANETQELFQNLDSSGMQMQVNLEDVGFLNIGDGVIIEGVVAVEPGIFSTQYFYIVGSPGIQVYNYKKDFPRLLVGDFVSVRGVISEINGEKRVKTQTSEDIVVLEAGLDHESIKLNCEDVAEQESGTLVRVQGELVQKKGSTMFLDDGSAESLVYIKRNTDISTSILEVGDEIEVTGVLVKNNNGSKIQPRSNEDIEILKNKSTENMPQVMGASEMNDEWSLPQRNKNIKLINYFLIIIVGVALYFILVYLKNKKSKQ